MTVLGEAQGDQSVPYDIEDNNVQATNIQGQAQGRDTIQGANLEYKRSQLKKHIYSVLFSIILFVVLIVLITYILLNSSSNLSNKFLINDSQVTALLGEGSFSSFSTNALQLNASAGSIISIIMGNATVYATEFSSGNQFLQEFIINRTNASKIFSSVSNDMNNERKTENILYSNGTENSAQYFYIIQNTNTSSKLMTLIARHSNTLAVFTSYFDNLSVNLTLKYISEDLNK
ncbi:MAG: hypothetical protein ACP5M9_02555 [Candidatus Micrarchaeia archaeon]